MDLRLQALIDHGLITREFLKKYQAEHSDDPLEKLLDNVAIAEEDYLNAVSQASGIPAYNIYHQPILTTHDIEPDLLSHYLFVPLCEEENGELVIGMADPFDAVVLEDLQFILNRQIRPRVVSPRALKLLLAVFSQQQKEHSHAIKDLEFAPDYFEAQEQILPPEFEDLVDNIANFDDQQSDYELLDDDHDGVIIKLVNKIIAWGREKQIERLSLEIPPEGNIRMRSYQQGEWRLVSPFEIERSMIRAMVARFKIIAGLDIAETRLPQNGQTGKELQPGLAIATIPTMHGEEIGIHYLSSSQQLSFQEIGFPEQLQQQLESVSDSGLIIVGGESGHGRMTTLYALAERFSSDTQKLVTVEMVPRRVLPNASQIVVSPKIGWDYASALRALLWQRPDVVLVGEVHNMETAQHVLHLTTNGSLVIGRMGSHQTHDTISRFCNMGMDPAMLTVCLRAAVNQRLVKILCSHCKKKTKNTDFPYRAGKCKKCNHTGFSGRRAVYHGIFMSDELASLLHEHKSIIDYVKALPQKQLRSSALELASEGVTTQLEAIRKTPPLIQ